MSKVEDDLAGGAEPVRYAIRRVGSGWTVYDYRTLEPLRVQGRVLGGLERDVARLLADRLTQAARRGTPVFKVLLPQAA